MNSSAQADVGTDLKMAFAPRRRGLALDIGDIISYENHDFLVNKLIEAYLRDPPPGYARVSLAQLARADTEAFRFLEKEVVGGIKRDEAKERPCDTAMVQVPNSPEFVQTLQSMPAGSAAEGKRAGSPLEDTDDEPKKKKVRLSQRQRKAAAAETKAAAAAATKG